MSTPAPTQTSTIWGKTPGPIVVAVIALIVAIVAFFNGPSSTPAPTVTATVTDTSSPTPTPSGTVVTPPVTTAPPTPSPSITSSPTPPAVTFPDASTTGWRHTGVTLTPSGPITVTTNGAVIDSRDVTGNINVKANNVTITRSRVTAGAYYPIRLYAGFSGLTVTDTEVVGINTATTECDAGINGGTTITRVDVSNCQDLLHPNAGSVIADSYLHDPYHSATSHNDGIQLFAGTGFTIRHNTILMGHTENAAVFVKADFGDLSNITIDGNYLDGGVYTVFGGDALPHTVTNVTVSNNTFGAFTAKSTTGPGPVYGQIFTSRMTGPVTVTGNVDTLGRNVP